jgi:hypothetical protein
MKDDVAVIQLSLDELKYDVACIPRELILTEEFLNAHEVGVGDEVVMIGRFRVQAGKKKNLPAAMFGYISMMPDPDEPIYNGAIDADEESCLVEMRSISGFSGSPVLLWIPPMSKRVSGTTLAYGYWRLLGVCWGYINVPEIAKDTSGYQYQLLLNSAMAAVVPIEKVMDIIDGDEMRKKRKKTDRELENKQNKSGITPASVVKNEKTKDLTQEDFEDVLRKIARPLPKDDQEKKGT